MDSFNIMDPCLDSMLPPGDVFRETFDTTLIGLESKFGGGGGGGDGGQKKAMKKQQKIQDKANKRAWEYEWDQVQTAYNDTLVRNALTRKQNEEALLYKEATSKQAWQYQMGIREHQYNAAVKQYNKAEKMYEAQVDYNQVAAQLAGEASAAARDERFDSVMFQGMTADTELGLKKSKIGTARAQAAVKMTGKVAEADQQKQGLTLERQAKRAEAAFSSQTNLTKSLQQRGQVTARGQTGRSTAKTYQSMVADFGRASAQLADQVNRADSAYNLAMVGIDKSLDLAKTDYFISKNELSTQERFDQLGYDLGKDQREYTKLSIGKAYDRELDKIKHDQYGANIRADAQRMSKPGMPPGIPKPLELPRTQILDPPLPVRPPKPLKGQGSPTPYSSGTGSGGGSGGMFGAVGTAAGAIGMAAGVFGPLGMVVGGAVGGLIDAIF